MPLRVNPNLSTDFFAELQIVRRQQNQALQQLASGSRINAPSDDPAGAAALLENQSQSDQVDQFQKNIQDLQPQLQAADSALSSVVSAVTQAISLGVEGGNSTLGASNLQSLAQEVSGIRDEILGIANTSVQGQYIFSGTLTKTAPYVLDAASPSGVSYQGNTGVNSIQLSNGQTAPINLPGSQLFSNPGGDLFGALQQLITALQTGTGVSAATAALSQAFSLLDNVRTFYGTTLNELNNSETFLSNESVQLSTQATQIAGADLAAATTTLAQTQTATTALLTSQGKALSLPTLFDFLP